MRLRMKKTSQVLLQFSDSQDIIYLDKNTNLNENRTNVL